MADIDPLRAPSGSAARVGEANAIDREIEEFHRAARKRKAWIFGIGAIISFALGLVFLAVWWASIEPQYHYGEYRALAGSIALILSGIGMGYNAYRIGSGQINDIE